MPIKIPKVIKIILDYEVSHIPLISRINKRSIIYFVTEKFIGIIT